MDSRDLYPQEILQVVLDKSCAKAQSSIPTLAILSILAGGYIGFGYLAYLKVVSGIPHEWGGFATLLGAAVFPIALICILLGGGELVTSNMMIMSLGRLAGRISSKMLLRNWVIVCMGNLVGTLAMAFFSRTLCRHDRRQRGRKNHCRGGSKSPYGFRSCFRIGSRM